MEINWESTNQHDFFNQGVVSLQRILTHCRLCLHLFQHHLRLQNQHCHPHLQNQHRCPRLQNQHHHLCLHHRLCHQSIQTDLTTIVASSIVPTGHAQISSAMSVNSVKSVQTQTENSSKQIEEPHRPRGLPNIPRINYKELVGLNIAQAVIDKPRTVK